MRTLILNSTHYSAGSGNTYRYQLPCTTKFQVGSKIGVVSLSCYNSTFNITASRGNNQITFIFNASTPQTKTYTIPDGYYSISDLNYWFQSKMIADGLYVTNTAGNFYFAEIVQNAVRYGVQVNTYYIPTSAQATTLGYSLPTSPTWTWPTSYQTPQITWNDAFGALIGQPAMTYPSTIQATNQSIISSITPIISPVNSYVITCNMINSRFSLPSNTFFSMPLSGSIGSLITYTASSVVMSDIAPNVYNEIVISFYDQLWNRLELIDKEIVLQLAIEEPENETVE